MNFEVIVVGFFFNLPLKMAGKIYLFDDITYVEELHWALLKYNDEN